MFSEKKIILICLHINEHKKNIFSTLYIEKQTKNIFEDFSSIGFFSNDLFKRYKVVFLFCVYFCIS